MAARGRAAQGDGQHLLGVALDITPRKRAEAQADEDRAALRHMTRVSLLGQLSASIAHQLNQPLASILSNAEAAQKMLQRDPVDLAELREICDDIVAEDHRAAEVIRRLGALFKRGEPTLVPLDVNELVRDTLDLTRTNLLTRHVAVSVELSAELPPVDGDRVQLQQLLLNLIVNAADAMEGTPEAERRLTVSTALTDGQVSDLRRRPRPGHRRGRPAQGLRSVLEHQGRRHGHGPGHLPLDRRGAPRLSELAQRGRGRRGVLRAAAGPPRAMTAALAPTVFIVDDDAALLRALSRLLREHGWQVATFASAEDFLAQRDVHAPGCLVLDVHLPGLDGLALQRRLAEDGPALPIVFLTGHGDIPMTVQALKAGAVDFLTKPVAADALLAAVRNGVELDALARAKRADGAALRQRLDSLTPREREVLAGLIAGKLNKQIAARPGHRRADGEVPPRAHHGAHAGAHRRRADAPGGQCRLRRRLADAAQRRQA